MKNEDEILAAQYTRKATTDDTHLLIDIESFYCKLGCALYSIKHCNAYLIEAADTSDEAEGRDEAEEDDEEDGLRRHRQHVRLLVVRLFELVVHIRISRRQLQLFAQDERERKPF